MIYDCFTFFNELDLLEIRLNVLDPIVDKFVVVEATKTFTNMPKPLYYEENKDRYADFADKIIHVVVDDYPDYVTAWWYENHQRNSIMRGLVECKDDDVIIISDIDEIPKPETVKRIKDLPGIKRLRMDMYVYFLNNYKFKKTAWFGSKVLDFKVFKQALSNRYITYGESTIPQLNIGTTPQKIRAYRGDKLIYDGGWHFSFLGGAEAVSEKIRSFSHQEQNKEEYTDVKIIKDRIRNGNEANSQKRTLMPVPIDKSFPEYLVKNVKKYEQHILPMDCNTISQENLELQRKRDYLFEIIRTQISNLLPSKLKVAIFQYLYR